ncbi:hypothetical protein V6C27_03090 [Peptococcaceae bacterium 1198_IL3148]
MVTDEQIINAIIELSGKGYPPSIREIGKLVGLRSSSTIHARLAKLRKAGIVEWEQGQPRTLRVVSKYA